jgi:hypothetical protein
MGVWYRLVLGVLATWRVTHLLHAEDGPWKLLLRFRTAVRASLGTLLDCFYCLSLWIAAPLAYLLGESWEERLWLLPALSAAAILLERTTTPPMPEFIEDPEDPDGMLWKEKHDASETSDRDDDGTS